MSTNRSQTNTRNIVVLPNFQKMQLKYAQMTICLIFAWAPDHTVAAASPPQRDRARPGQRTRPRGTSSPSTKKQGLAELAANCEEEARAAIKAAAATAKAGSAKGGPGRLPTAEIEEDKGDDEAAGLADLDLRSRRRG